MPASPRFSTCLAAGLLLLAAHPAWAQLPHARLDRIFPLGGKAGTTVEVDVQGRDLDELTALRFDHPGLEAVLVKGGRFRVSIAASVPEGTYEVRTVGKWGISGTRLFAVAHGLAEVAETEPNDTPATAQKVPLDCAVNGNSDNEGDDYFRFTARKGQRIVLDCWALRLDSTLRAALVLSDAGGKELARSRPYHSRTDPLLDFVAPAHGDYIVGLHDSTYTGGLPYRLVISTRPYIENVFPQVVAPGQTVQLTVLGRNLPGGKPADEGKLLDLDLDTLTVPFTAPKSPLHRFSFLTHLPAPSAEAAGLQFRPRGLENALNPATVLLADGTVVAEKEPNDSPEKAQALTLPCAVSGRFDRPGDSDWYALDLKAGESVRVDLYAERLDLPGDPFVLVTDAKGKELAQIDDHGTNFNALALYNRDPLGVFTAPAAGTYRLLVQERYRNGGPRYRYILRLSKPEPDFYPVCFPETNPDPTSPLVRRGGSAFLEVCLNRRNLPGPVLIEAEGLPSGVSCPPVHVSPQTEFAPVVFTVSAGARDWAGPLKLRATGTVDGKPGGTKIVREVQPVQRRWAIANISTSRLSREVCLAVRGEAPYGLSWSVPKVTASAGKPVEATVKVQRGADFKGAVRLNGLILPPGFGFASAEVPAGKDELKVTLSVAASVPPGTYSIVLRGDAQVPFARDPKAASKPNVRVADPSAPLLVTVQAARAK